MMTINLDKIYTWEPRGELTPHMSRNMKIQFKEAMPEFCEEVKGLLEQLGENRLIQQLDKLFIIGRCDCKESIAKAIGSRLQIS